ncbi:MAG: prepilin-type N-terminal cleavage/methylation domain-containing protein [Candidatus Liptonbacteria bacterium]|nr:prepilin-type N-terminal cleavage/methylation domain-containing protein [Candidatus Liptonbacteria bacterium]
MTKGFSIIEILIVMAILTIIAGFVAGVGSNFYNNQALIGERDSVIGLLRSARTRAINNINQASHGVYIGASQYVAFDGESYAARKQDYDAVFPRSLGATIMGPSEIVFKAIEGTSNVSGTITISSGIGSVTISLNGEGMVNW